MDKQQIRALQRLFKKIEPNADTNGELFYTKLFELDPSLRPLFKNDSKTQGRMLMTAISMAIQSLDQPEAITAQLQEIGHRHLAYGTIPMDFDKFGAALLWTLEQSLGDEFTPALQATWVDAFHLITTQMKISTH